MKASCVTAVVLAAGLAGCASVGDGAPISAYDKAHMSAQAFTSRLFNQLEAQVQQPDSNRTPNASLTSYGAWLRPTGTYLQDLCRHDQLFFDFVPAADGTPDIRTRVRAMSVSVQSTFHFLKPPVPGDRHINTPDERRELDRRCADLPDDAFKISASNPLTAQNGMLAVAALREQGKNLTDKSKFDCADGSSDGCTSLAAGPWYGFGDNCDYSLRSVCVVTDSGSVITIIRYIVRGHGIEFLSIRQDIYENFTPITGPNTDFIN